MGEGGAAPTRLEIDEGMLEELGLGEDEDEEQCSELAEKVVMLKTSYEEVGPVADKDIEAMAAKHTMGT